MMATSQGVGAHCSLSGGSRGAVLNTAETGRVVPESVSDLISVAGAGRGELASG